MFHAAKQILTNLPGFPVAEHFIMTGHLINDALVHRIMHLGKMGNGSSWR